MKQHEGRRPLVLVIEDDRDARRLFAEQLQRAGYAVSEAHNGLQAIEKAGDLVPDAIVTDLAIPGIDGFELCRRLQRDTRLARIPVVAMTGRYLAAADIERARHEGCQSVLLKPFGGDELVAAVRKVLNQ